MCGDDPSNDEDEEDGGTVEEENHVKDKYREQDQDGIQWFARCRKHRKCLQVYGSDVPLLVALCRSRVAPIQGLGDAHESQINDVVREKEEECMRVRRHMGGQC